MDNMPDQTCVYVWEYVNSIGLHMASKITMSLRPNFPEDEKLGT